MKRIRHKLCGPIFYLFLAVAGHAGEVVVVVNPNSQLSASTAKEITRVFRGKSTSVDGIKVVPIDQDKDSPARADFSDKILGRPVAKMEEYWKKQVFSGKGEPPASVHDDADVIAYVDENPDAIGYISAGSLTDEVKAVLIDGRVKW